MSGTGNPAAGRDPFARGKSPIMAIRLEIISEHKRMLDDEFERAFGPDGGTIGRSLQNDWVLPDTERFISGQHATIDCRAGSYYLADVSSNGVYVNHALEPLGKGNPRRLFDGDHLRMGNFEMVVHLDEGEDLELPPEPKASVVPDQIDQLFPVDDMQSSVMLLDEEEITEEKAFSDAFRLDRDDGPERDSAPEVPPPSPVCDATSQESPDDGDGLLETFLRSAGIDPDDIHPSVDPAEIMGNAGRVLAELVSGMTDLLVARSNVKSMFRLDQTTVMPRHNNPLKLSASTADSLRQLLVGREGEYLGPLDSVREATRDLRWHHDAVVAAMIKSFGEFLERFDPEHLEEEFRTAFARKPLFKAMAKRKYWELYCDVYPVITQPGTATLPHQYSEDFVRHYEKQLEDFKRIERTLGKTQTLDRPAGGADNPAPSASGEMFVEDSADAENDDPLDETVIDEDDAFEQRA